ncbi:MAG: division plane positioning ATPase MipZ [Holosporaceae bacterium]|jgi:chromosome partitioning protein|nr:division plane positioning ATPase MipZ [Holosporaceae bacterium]
MIYAENMGNLEGSMTNPYVVVLGNEKGGTGKSTIAMHLSIYLLHSGFRVGTVDVDARQGTLTRYFEYRRTSTIANLLLPTHFAIKKSDAETIAEAKVEDGRDFHNAMEALADHDFVIIDTPGNDTFLSQLAHSYANTLITPINDSFVDLDVLVNINGNDHRQLRPSIYAEMVWNQRKEHAKMGQKPIDWIVLKNRLTTLFNKNRNEINLVLDVLSKRIGFRICNGFCDRVVFKELFLSGLTLLDLEQSGQQMSLSHVSARQELRELIAFMKLPQLSEK